jgi:DNA-binding transcriptional MerR regulator
MQRSAEDDDLITTLPSARILGCSPDRVRQLERAGVLPARRVSGIRMFRRADVERLRVQRESAGR